jgi:2-dehydropantoate 2-reductase
MTASPIPSFGTQIALIRAELFGKAGYRRGAGVALASLCAGAHLELTSGPRDRGQTGAEEIGRQGTGLRRTSVHRSRRRPSLLWKGIGQGRGFRTTKVSVLGAGAVGSIFGGLIRLRDPAVDVVMIGRGAHGERMCRTGHLALETPWGTHTVSVRGTNDLAEIAGSDLVLLTVKSQDTEAAIRGASAYLGSAVVATLQNGINQRVLVRHVAPDRLVMGMTATNMKIAEPGIVALQRNGITVVGSCTQSAECPAVQTAVRILGGSGLKVVPSDDIVGSQYNKLLLNTLGYSSVLSGTDFISEGILYGPWRHTVAIPLLDEGMEILRRAGIRLNATPGLSDVHRFRHLLHLLEQPFVGATARFAAKLFRPRRPLVFSVYQDLIRRRRTEIDFVNGEIVELARSHGGAAPRNAKVVELVRELERRHDGTFFSRDEVIDTFRRIAN